MNPPEQDHSSPFVDPALKSAVVRAWGDEKAPPSLRANIERMIRATPPAKKLAPKKSPQTIRQRLMWPLAASIGLVLFFQIRALLPPPAPPKLTALPSQLYTDLIARHDACIKSADHHLLAVSKDNDAAIAKAMQAELLQSVLIARPAGWVFRGASICMVGDFKSGHLLFTKNSTALSIFTLPDGAAPGLTDGLQFQTTINSHPIASFSRNGGLFALVESDPTGAASLAQLVQMRGTLETAVTPAPGCAGACPPPSVDGQNYAANPTAPNQVVSAAVQPHR